MYFCYVFCVFSCYSRLVFLQSIIHQHSWNLLVITPTTTVGVHFLCLCARVDGIYFGLNSRQQEPPKAPPQKQVWIPKPNHLRNPFDTLLDIYENLLPKAKQPTKVYHAHQRESKPPKREMMYHCEYCKRDGHLAEFSFRRKRDEGQEYELNNREMYHPYHSICVPPT